MARELVEKISDALRSLEYTLATAESCTGGLIAAAITDLPGASAVFERGFVTYSNAAKRDLLAVTDETLSQYGAVSEQAARAMVIGALGRSPADVAIAVTGIAGPGGGGAEKPVGLVYIGVGSRDDVLVKRYLFTGDRAAIRVQSRDAALADLLAFLA